MKYFPSILKGDPDSLLAVRLAVASELEREGDRERVCVRREDAEASLRQSAARLV